MEEKRIHTAEHHETAPNAHDRVNNEGSLGQGNVPEVDTQYAATIQVSKLKGKWLMWMVCLNQVHPQSLADQPWQVTVVAGTGFTLLGFDQGVVSGLLTLPSFEAQFPETAGGFQGSKSATLQSFLVAICERRLLNLL